MSKHPNFMLSVPEPNIRQRLYNGRKLVVWEGKVKVSAIDGWVSNPRIELAKKRLAPTIGPRELTQDEVAELMKSEPDIKLAALRDDILKNGLRQPITLSFTGRLLDGNRRFFAIKYALESLPATDPARQDLETVSAYVLTKDASEEDEHNVLVEENFSASLKIEWPDYVKSRIIIEEYEKNDLSVDEIAKKFNWSKTKVKETIRINEVIEDFVTLATAEPDSEDDSGGGFGLSETEAQTTAAKNYQFFNEAQKSFMEPLKTDVDFKVQFFRWINEGKFSSFPEVRIAHKAWTHPEAKAALMQSEPNAAKAAKAIVDYTSRVVKSTDEAVGRIDNFVKFLRELKAQEIKDLPQSSREKLEDALKIVIKMHKAAKS